MAHRIEVGVALWGECQNDLSAKKVSWRAAALQTENEARGRWKINYQLFLEEMILRQDHSLLHNNFSNQKYCSILRIYAKPASQTKLVNVYSKLFKTKTFCQILWIQTISYSYSKILPLDFNSCYSSCSNYNWSYLALYFSMYSVKHSQVRSCLIRLNACFHVNFIEFFFFTSN